MTNREKKALIIATDPARLDDLTGAELTELCLDALDALGLVSDDQSDDKGGRRGMTQEQRDEVIRDILDLLRQHERHRLEHDQNALLKEENELLRKQVRELRSALRRD